ncbi:MAG: PPOX class F420-dependent oxidoreductase [Candidatus Eremiobacteraeota bacterium]|nr:PPOX class F420-dependent oxidoreductase [Candidatus Eremiobacteraeota bacterium]
MSIPDKYKDILEKPVLAHLCTLLPDGSPQSTPVWFHYRDGLIEVNSAKDRRKDKNMRARPQVALSMLDPENSYRYLEVRGEVIDISEEGADAHIDMLAKKYLGLDSYPYRSPSETRVIYKIKPTASSAMG